jgi:hypothetical protein
MNKAIEAFRASMDRARHLGGLHEALSALTTSAVDASDLLRAQIVLGVSALYYYVHEITVLGMVAVFEGRRSPTPAFLKYRVAMDSVLSGISTECGWFESDIRERHSYLSFQHPDKIADAIRLFSNVKLWHHVALQLSIPEQEAKARLKLIVDRRNKIAHEADVDPSFPNMRWPISKSDVDHSLAYIAQICESIYVAVQ